jgi:hypothetical protein
MLHRKKILPVVNRPLIRDVEDHKPVQRQSGEKRLNIAAKTWLPRVLIATAIVLGGGSASYPGPRMVVELFAVAAIVVSIANWKSFPRDAAVLVPSAIALLLLLLIVVQLVPLPPALWMALPGRDLAADTARALNQAATWRPISLDPEATVRAALTLLPGYAMFTSAVMMDSNEKQRLVEIFLVGILFSLLVGVVQVGGGANSPFYFYRSGYDLIPAGVFANRNHQAIFVAMGLPTGASLLALYYQRTENVRRTMLLLGMLAVLCALGVLATGSRTGSALLPLAFAGAILIAVPPKWLSRPAQAAVGLGSAVFCGVAISAVVGCPLRLLA